MKKHLALVLVLSLAASLVFAQGQKETSGKRTFNNTFPTSETIF
jgi:hypothetical protein